LNHKKALSIVSPFYAIVMLGGTLKFILFKGHE